MEKWYKIGYKTLNNRLITNHFELYMGIKVRIFVFVQVINLSQI